MRDPFPLALPNGRRVEELVIDSVIGYGSFGITYLAHDQALGTQLALKEYLPRELARRSADGAVGPLTPADERAFDDGLERFLTEGRVVAQLDHPNVVKVQRLIRANGTAYLQMPFYAGEPLGKLLERTGTFSDREVRLLVEPLLDALRYIHRKGVTHRDIKPSNIYLTRSGSPILLDFGAARVTTSEGTESHTAMGSEGYAALEQASTQGRLGPWTDVYGLSATLYRLITGATPVPAASRADEVFHDRPDPLPPITRVAGSTHSASLLQAIDVGLSIRATDRPQSVDEWLLFFEGTREPDRAHAVPAAERDDLERVPWIVILGGSTLLLLLVAAAVFVLTRPDGAPGELERAADGAAVPALEAESDAWTRAYTADTAQAYRKYLDAFPRGTNAELARKQLQGFEPGAWDAAQAANTIEAFEEYVSLFAESEQVPVAQGHLDRLREEAERAGVLAEREQQAWERARNIGTADALNEYLSAFPAGAHAAEARAAIQAAERARRDEEAYGVAKASGTRRAYQRYLDAFPAGRHAAEAMQRIEAMRMRPGKVFADCRGCPSMVVVPAGSMKQGSPRDSLHAKGNEQPQHSVRIPRMFAIGRYEVTFDEWDLCVEKGGCPAVASDGGWGRGTHPVINVSWEDAQGYAAWLSKRTGKRYRLPSESEWEYAARAGQTSTWIGGDPAQLCAFGNGAGTETGLQHAHQRCSDRHKIGTGPKGSYEKNGYGLYDVIGNVSEWTQDCMNLSYVDAPADGSAWERGLCSARVVRGGSWVHGESDLRLSARARLRVRDANDFTGFRVVREVDD